MYISGHALLSYFWSACSTSTCTCIVQAMLQLMYMPELDSGYSMHYAFNYLRDVHSMQAQAHVLTYSLLGKPSTGGPGGGFSKC